MLYSQLVQYLSRLEGKYLGNGTRSTHMVPRQAARFIVDRENVQYFALDSGQACPRGKPMREIDAPVVVAIGSNYTQGSRRLPSASLSGLVTVWPFVEDNLPTMRSNLDAYFHLYRTRRLAKIWRTEEGREIRRYAKFGQRTPPLSNDVSPARTAKPPASSADVVPGDSPLTKSASPDTRTPSGRYHLVAANFTPWITTELWSEIRNDHASQAATLFDYPPHGTRTFVEFDDLAKLLPDDTIWVGHGNHDVFDLFMSLAKRYWSLPEWFFRSNLTQPIQPPLPLPPVGSPTP